MICSNPFWATLTVLIELQALVAGFTQRIIGFGWSSVVVALSLVPLGISG